MLRLLLIFISFLLIACSKDRLAPVAPAGKVAATTAAPAEPTNLRVEALTDTSAKVAWDAVEGATDYDINYRTLSGRWTNEPHKGTRLHNTIYDLEPDTEYRWAIRAENRDGRSEWVFSQENFTTLATDDLEINIEVVWLYDFKQSFKDNMMLGLDVWEKAFVSGLPDFNADDHTQWQLNDYFYCGNQRVDFPRHVDDIVVYVVENEDEYAGGYAYQVATKENGTAAVGCIAVSDNTKTGGAIYYDHVFAHEFGHVLGIGYGEFWHENLVENDSLYFHINEFYIDNPYHKNLRPSFIVSPQAIEGFNQMGSWPIKEVPVDSSNRVHWARYPLGNSIMSYGYIYEPRITKVDMGFLRDVGYPMQNQSPTEPVYLIIPGETYIPSGRNSERDALRKVVAPQNTYVYKPEFLCGVGH